MSTRYHAEVWALKGVEPLCIYDNADRAWQHVDEAAHLGLELRVELVTITTRREVAKRPLRAPARKAA